MGKNVYELQELINVIVLYYDYLCCLHSYTLLYALQWDENI